jgi:hypothetical protein
MLERDSTSSDDLAFSSVDSAFVTGLDELDCPCSFSVEHPTNEKVTTIMERSIVRETEFRIDDQFPKSGNELKYTPNHVLNTWVMPDFVEKISLSPPPFRATGLCESHQSPAIPFVTDKSSVILLGVGWSQFSLRAKQRSQRRK